MKLIIIWPDGWTSDIRILPSARPLDLAALVDEVEADGATFVWTR